MPTQNFTLVTELQGLIRRDFTVATKSDIDPTSTNPILDGEFAFVNGSYKLVRATAAGLGWAVFSERGRFDVQSSGKLTVLYGPIYEADTLVMTSTSIVLGSPLEIGNVTYDGQTRSGLVVHSAGITIGYCTRIPANNGNKLRFVQTLF